VDCHFLICPFLLWHPDSDTLFTTVHFATVSLFAAFFKIIECCYQTVGSGSQKSNPLLWVSDSAASLLCGGHAVHRYLCCTKGYGEAWS